MEKEVDWGDDVWTLTCDLKEVKATIMTAIERLEYDLEADNSVICLSQGLTFRHEIYPAYKAGRSRKPVGTNEVKRWLVEEKGAKLKPGIEADDIMGIIATNPRMYPGDKIIVSQDKDMLTIPGKLYRHGEVVEVSEDDAAINWMTQTLTGDVTDGYPGCPSIGAVKANRIIQDAIDANAHLAGTAFHCIWPAVIDTYKAKGLTEEDALLQAQLARILHNDDYDHAKKEPILWKP